MSPRHVPNLPLLALAVASVAADAAASTLSLRYDAPGVQAPAPSSACPSAAEFRQAIEARGVDFEAPGVAARASSIDVSIRYVGGQYVGELSVQAPDGVAASRVVHDARCDAVASGLAVTAAIALGGKELFSMSRDAPVEAEPAAVSDAAVEAPTDAAGGSAADAAELPELEHRLRGSSFGQPNELVVDAGELRFEGARAYTLTAGATLGPIPGQLMPRYDLTASLASFVMPPGAESRLFGPLQVHWAVHGPVQARYAGDVTLEAWGLEAGIDSCSAFTYDTLGWVALACAEFGAGWLFAETRGPSAAERASVTRGYGFGGLAFDAQFNLGSMLHVGARVGGRFMTPFSLEAPDGTGLFDSSMLGAYATIGFGLHF